MSNPRRLLYYASLSAASILPLFAHPSAATPDLAVHTCGSRAGGNSDAIRIFHTAARIPNTRLQDAIAIETQRMSQFFGIESNVLFLVNEEREHLFAVSKGSCGFSGNVILVGVDFINLTIARFSWSGIALLGVIAHEAAHIVQFQRAEAFTSRHYAPLLQELHADVMAGAYLGKLRRTDTFDPQSVIDTLSDVAHDSTLSNRTHGSSYERKQAFRNGFNRGYLGPDDPDSVFEDALLIAKSILTAKDQ